MKRLAGFCFLAALMITGLMLPDLEAGTRKCLGELFTNTSCGPCKNANLQLDRWTDPNDPAYVPDWIVIRYHTWWPSSADPFYAVNTYQNKARTNYYGVNAVPNMRLGHVDGGSSYVSWKTMAEQQIGETTPYNMQLYGAFDSSTGELTVQAHVFADTSIAGTDHRIFFVVTQDDIAWNAPNGQKVFFQTMVRMLNGTTGTLISLQDGDYQVFSQTYTLDPNWPNKAGITIDWQKTNIVAFIQSYGNKRIKAVEASRVMDLAPVPALWADRVNLSAATGADIDLNLQAGVDHANRPYLTLGSITGTSPGTTLPGGEVLPLNWDLFTGVVIGLINTPFFANFQGTLDANGQAIANFNTFGAIDPAAIGLTFNYAFTLMSPFDRVSNAVDVPVLP